MAGGINQPGANLAQTQTQARLPYANSQGAARFLGGSYLQPSEFKPRTYAAPILEYPGLVAVQEDNRKPKSILPGGNPHFKDFTGTTAPSRLGLKGGDFASGNRGEVLGDITGSSLPKRFGLPTPGGK